MTSYDLRFTIAIDGQWFDLFKRVVYAKRFGLGIASSEDAIEFIVWKQLHDQLLTPPDDSEILDSTLTLGENT